MDEVTREGARRPTQAQIAKATEGRSRHRVSRTAISAWRKGERVPESWAALSSFLSALEEAASLPRGRLDAPKWVRLYERARAEQVPEPGPQAVTFRVRDADPLELKVHRARTVEGGDAVPAYIPRDVDPAVRQAMSHAGQRGGVILLVGDSTAGKTRCAYEAMTAVLPDHLLVVPRHVTEVPEAVAAVTRSARAGERCVLWLNDMERYLGPEGMDLHGIRALRTAKATVLGTMRTRMHQQFTDDELVRLAEEFQVERLWSSCELDRAHEELRSNRDPRLRLALDQATDFGVAETLATGPQLWQRLCSASVVNGNPRGAALVWAAIDLALAGLTDPLPAELLEELHEDYLPGRNKQLIGPEPLDEALAWATTPPDAVTRLLIPDGAGLRAFDYLLDAHLRAKGASPEFIPERVWETALRVGTERRQRFDIALAAHANERIDISRRALRPLADAGDVDGLRGLGVLCEREDRTEAARWLQLACDAGDVLSLRLMGNLHFRRQDRKAAAEWYRKAAEAGDEVSQSYYHGEPSPVPARPTQAPSAPLPTHEEDEEGEWEDEDYGPTPRTLCLLGAAFEILADMAYDELEEIGDTRVDLRDNYACPFSDMPVLTWGQKAGWRRQMARCFDDLANDIEAGNWPLPTCTGEEMAMHLALEHASAMVRDEPDFVAALVKSLPEDSQDYDWDLCMTLFLEDTDVLFLYEPWSQGIEDPDSLLNQHLGIANLQADRWFEPFREDKTRDPGRGFRR
ncbi:sel1 repeat family protein [Streptomyces klenkii]|uniref:Sel1 repeat family protein n=1 Tax=Streptomyces klenkii TaxID=1420899 RepID=A0A3B0BSJ6_9ACTN|nr:sel1 repeat family protein [Streptomyces klenkii]RKN75229.1 sel1 repeat family protein [Streptomyces klenkii]